MGVWTRIAESANADRLQMRDIFLAEMDQLLLPAYLLTGSHEQAAECFLEAWEVCNEQPPPTPRYVLRVAKRAILKAAIRRIAAEVSKNAENDMGAAYAGPAANAQVISEKCQLQLNSATFRQSVLNLNAFHRSALVLRLYEGYPSVEAALLLGVSRRTMEIGWQRALIGLLNNLELMKAERPIEVGPETCAKGDWHLKAVKVPA
jgi:DNA-directed RNA polymerase specialized sigma24 family protein